MVLQVLVEFKNISKLKGMTQLRQYMLALKGDGVMVRRGLVINFPDNEAQVSSAGLKWDEEEKEYVELKGIKRDTALEKIFLPIVDEHFCTWVIDRKSFQG